MRAFRIAVLLASSACGGGDAAASSSTSESTAATSAVSADDGGLSSTFNDGCSGPSLDPPPLCPEACACGVAGSTACDPDATRPRTTMWRCNDDADCVEVVDCAEGRTCIFLGVEHGACSDVLDCEGVQVAYAALIGLAHGCDSAGDCRLLQGHCGIGLGGCVHAVGPLSEGGAERVSQAILDELAMQWQALGCEGTVCDDCSGAPTTARCEVGFCTPEL